MTFITFTHCVTTMMMSPYVHQRITSKLPKKKGKLSLLVVASVTAFYTHTFMHLLRQINSEHFATYTSGKLVMSSGLSCFCCRLYTELSPNLLNQKACKCHMEPFLTFSPIWTGLCLSLVSKI